MNFFVVFFTSITEFLLAYAPSDIEEKKTIDSEDEHVGLTVEESHNDAPPSPLTAVSKDSDAAEPPSNVMAPAERALRGLSTHVKEKPQLGMWDFIKSTATTTRLFLVVMFMLEMGQSVTESLEFLFIVEKLGATPLLCGLSVACAVSLEVPILFSSSVLLRTFGVLMLMLFGVFIFIVRVMVFSVITSSDAWVILSVEPLNGVFVGFLKMSAVAFMSQTAPPGREAVAMGTLNIFRALGQVAGTIVGSAVMQEYGSTILFYAFAVLVFCAGLLLSFTFWLRRRTGGVVQEATLRTRGGSVFAAVPTQAPTEEIKSEIGLLEMQRSGGGV